MKLSLLTPVYNAEATLPRLLDSVYQQNDQLDAFQWIFINDGSTDASGSIIKRYQNRYKNIAYMYKENTGVSDTRNQLLKQVHTPYLAFIDSDDFYEPHAIDIILANLKAHPSIDCLVFPMYITDLKNKKQILKNEDQLETIHRSKCFRDWLTLKNRDIYGPYGCNKVYKKAVIQKYQLQFNTKIDIAEDLAFNISYFCHIHQVKMIQEPLYNYYENPHSITRGTNLPNYLQSILELEKEIQANSKKYKIEYKQGELRLYLLSRFYGLLLNEAKLKDFHQGLKDLKTYKKAVCELNHNGFWQQASALYRIYDILLYTGSYKFVYILFYMFVR